MQKPYTIIIGATGSVGRQAIDLITEYNKIYNKELGEKPINIVALVNKNNKSELDKLQIKTGAKYTLTTSCSKTNIAEFIKQIADKYGNTNLTALNAASGFEGLKISVELAKNHITTLLANKETAVCGGQIYFDLVLKNKADIIPVDSEHSAIYSLIKAHGKPAKIIITASGGAFRDKNPNKLDALTAKEALEHPTWKMGAKITIDCATMANKLLEVVEAKNLFNLEPEQVEIALHAQSIAHSLIQMQNGSVYAELSIPDMKLPLAKAYGITDQAFIKPLDFNDLKLTFNAPSSKQYKFLNLKDEVLKSHTMSIVFNAANEIAVNHFLQGKLKYSGIYETVKRTMDAYKINHPAFTEPQTFKEIYKVDSDSRLIACDFVAK